jgi:hypothetical protein
LVVVSGIWIATHLPALKTQLSILANPQPGPGAGSFFYIKSVLLSFYGLPLALGTAVLLAINAYRKKLTMVDIALVVWFALPLVLLGSFQTKRSYFILPAFVAMPILYASLARSLRGTKKGATIDACLVSIFALIALGNIFITTLGAAGQFPAGDQTMGIRAPYPPDNDEKQIVSMLLDDVYKSPTAIFALDTSATTMEFSRLQILLLLAEPRLVLTNSFSINDYTGNQLDRFLSRLPNSSRLTIIGKQHAPVTRIAQKNYLYSPFGSDMLNEKVTALSLMFSFESSQKIDDALFATIYSNRSIVHSKAETPSVTFDDYLLRKMLEDSQTHKRYLTKTKSLVKKGEYSHAQKRYLFILESDPHNVVAILGYMACLPHTESLETEASILSKIVTDNLDSIPIASNVIARLLQIQKKIAISDFLRKFVSPSLPLTEKNEANRKQILVLLLESLTKEKLLDAFNKTVQDEIDLHGADAGKKLLRQVR